VRVAEPALYRHPACG